MQRDHVLSILRQHRAELDQFGVRTISVFGSVARDEARVDSDVDILVEFNGSVTFSKFMGLKLYLEDLLGVKVDLAVPEALKPRVRPIIEREAIHVA